MPAIRRLPRSRLSLNQWLMIFAVLAFLGLGYCTEKYIIHEDLDDGFTNQIHYVTNCLSNEGLKGLVTRELGLVHLMRYVSIWPLYWLVEGKYHHLWQYLILLVAQWPIVTARLDGRRVLLQPLLLLLPLFISFRAVLVSCSLSYLFLLLFTSKKSRLLLVLSAVWANLSSGSAIEWLLISLLHGRKLSSEYKLLYWACAAYMVISCIASASNKNAYFHEIRSSRSTSLEAMYSQNTILVSYQHRHMARLAVYIVMAAAGGGILLRCALQRRISRKYAAFFAVAVPGFLVEGLSVLGFIVPGFWFYTGFRVYSQRAARMQSSAQPPSSVLSMQTPARRMRPMVRPCSEARQLSCPRRIAS